MIRKILAAYKILTCHGYILCTIKKGQESYPDYDHNVTEESVLRYNGYINSIYNGNEDALRQAKEILNID